MSTERNCGTCARWESDLATEPYGQCTWEPREPLPFWATLDRGSDHDDATAPTDGARCKTWVLAAGLARG